MKWGALCARDDLLHAEMAETEISGLATEVGPLRNTVNIGWETLRREVVKQLCRCARILP